MDKPLLHDEIPIAVMWNKDLTDKDKLVFGEIYTMIHQGKPFIMSNKHMAARFNCSARTISKSVSHLIKTNWIKARNIKSKTGSTEYRQIYGINLLRALKFSSRSHRNISLGIHEENFHQIDQNNTSVNTSVTNNKDGADKIIYLLENQGLVFNSIVTDEVSELLHHHPYKLVLQAVRTEALHNTPARYLITNIKDDIRKGFTGNVSRHKSRSNNRVYHNLNETKRTAQGIAIHRQQSPFARFTKQDLSIAKFMNNHHMDTHSDEDISKAISILRGDNNA